MDRILTVNAGSSTLKVHLLDGSGTEVLASSSEAWDGHVASARRVLATVVGEADVDVVVHRVVHGGPRHEPSPIDAELVQELQRLAPLDPLHQLRALAVVGVAEALAPDAPGWACFDTAFHATLPQSAWTLPLPPEWRALGVRRYGFHGLSHAWAAGRAAEELGRPVDELRLVTCHLGSGSSLCAVAQGRSVDTTMGFTPLDGLVMATRSGSLDPGVVTWLVDRLGRAEVEEGLSHRSGLQGLAGHGGDVREVLAAADRGDADAHLALAVWTRSVRSGIAAMAASMGGLDAIVFTGGIGEHQPRLRERVVDGLGFLGPVPTLVVPAREELEMAREVLALHG